MEKPEIIELKAGIYWVGVSQQNVDLHNNPYLLIEGDEGILFDPGSVLDFESVYKNVTSLIPIEKLKYIVLHHQNPNICSSVTLFEKKGGNFKIVTHWRTQRIVTSYGIKSEFYDINKHDFQLILKTGRKLDFIQTPYLYFPGAITTFDSTSKILFSSNLFGAISYEWSLYAEENYLEKMKVYHEHYMPSNDILRPVMEVFLGMNIAMIAPQNGSIITLDVKKYIRTLRDLECGVFLTPIRKELAKSGGYRMLCRLILQRYVAIFGLKDVEDILHNIGITMNTTTFELGDYDDEGVVLWNHIFDQIAVLKDMRWLILIEPLVQKLSKEYQVPMPLIFNSIMKESYELHQVNQKLHQVNQQLEIDIKETKERLLRCPITGLFNFDFFRQYLTAKILSSSEEMNSALVILNIDNMAKIRFSYGDNEVNEVLKNTVYLIESIINENSTMLFRLQGAAFALYIPDKTKEDVIQNAEKIRNLVSASQSNIESITLSIGVVFLDEINFHDAKDKQPFELLYELAMQRVKLAHKRGKNIVSSHSVLEDHKESPGKILIADIDEVNLEVLKTVFENLDYEVLTAIDGEQLLSLAKSEHPDAIITEIMLPKKDAFMVRESLLMQSLTKDILFIIVSHLKNEDAMERALSHGIIHFFKKPIMLSELLGIIKLKIKGDLYP